MSTLEAAGFRCYVPGGAYYVMTDISAFDATDDVSFARELVERRGVAGVPGIRATNTRGKGRPQRDDTGLIDRQEQDRGLADRGQFGCGAGGGVVPSWTPP